MPVSRRTALSLGTTAAWQPSKTLALNATALLGVGYAAVSDIVDVENDRAQHDGIAPQFGLALRLTFEERASVEASART